MARYTKEEWLNKAGQITRHIEQGMSSDEALDRVGVSNSGYYRAQKVYGLPSISAKAVRKNGQSKSGRFVSYVPVSEGGIKVKIGKVEFNIPSGDMEALKTIIAAASREDN